MVGQAEINILSIVRGHFREDKGGRTLKKRVVSVDWSLEKIINSGRYFYRENKRKLQVFQEPGQITELGMMEE
jgi:hypothetical protein